MLVRLWAIPSKVHQGQFALEVAAHVLANYSVWYDIPFALPKMDVVAIPE